MGVDDVSAIGQRARMIRRRRGLSLDVVGGLAGITGPYLSMLERGLRGRWSWLAPELGVGLKLSPRAGILRTPRWREVFLRTWRHPYVPSYYPELGAPSGQRHDRSAFNGGDIE